MLARLVLNLARLVQRLPHGETRDRCRAILFAGAGRPFGLSPDEANAIVALVLDATRHAFATL